MLKDQCECCPRRQAGLPGSCIAQHSLHSDYCQRVQAGDEDAVLATLAWQPPGPVLTQSGWNAEPATAEPTEPIEVATLRPPPSEVRLKFERMKRCPHWRASSSCGCGVNECGLGLGDRGRVSHHDCFECPELPAAT